MPRFRFGRFLFDTAAYRLQCDGRDVEASPQTLDLLRLFVEQPGTLLTKPALLAALWPDVAVTDNALTQAVSELRHALDDTATAPMWIQTVARRGYRFIGVVQREAVHPTGTPIAPPPDARSIAVLDFENVTRDPDIGWLSAGIAETMTSDLGAVHALRVFDRGRVLEAVKDRGSTPAAVRDTLGVTLAVVGSFQRAGDRLRITARVVDAASGETRAHARSDGFASDVFALQDRIVTELIRELGIAVTSDAAARIGVNETSSVEAYQALTEGRLALEQLDPALLTRATECFERALALDSRYALAHVGLANAQFLRYETSRARLHPEKALLASAVAHAERAATLDPGLAEAHATLAFLLVSAERGEEARAAGRRAVALDPRDWRHQFRLAHASWGEERLRALDATVAFFPGFAYAFFERGMVHVARGKLERAEAALREGASLQDRQAARRSRFPAAGLHWLLGLTRLAQGDPGEAILEFESELASTTSHLYTREFAMDAWDGIGFAYLRKGDAAQSEHAFQRALALVPDHARSQIGLAAVFGAHRSQPVFAEQIDRADRAITAVEQTGRLTEARLLGALLSVVRGNLPAAVTLLGRLLDEAPPGFAGWTIPVEPLLTPLRTDPRGQVVLDKLADRCR
jgi:DNA-binding winged helix-turn-helix (wHTH) protein/tetratricopeptide (TPR) repeat protein